MKLSGQNGKVEIYCDVQRGQEAPIVFCKCESCVEARAIHRYKRSIYVSEPTGEIKSNIMQALRRKAQERARMEARRARALPFNGLRVVGK